MNCWQQMSRPSRNRWYLQETLYEDYELLATNVQTISEQVVPIGNTIWRLWTAGNKCPSSPSLNRWYLQETLYEDHEQLATNVQPISEQVVPTGNTIWGLWTLNSWQQMSSPSRNRTGGTYRKHYMRIMNTWTACNKCPAHLEMDHLFFYTFFMRSFFTCSFLKISFFIRSFFIWFIFDMVHFRYGSFYIFHNLLLQPSIKKIFLKHKIWPII